MGLLKALWAHKNRDAGILAQSQLLGQLQIHNFPSAITHYASMGILHTQNAPAGLFRKNDQNKKKFKERFDVKKIYNIADLRYIKFFFEMFFL